MEGGSSSARTCMQIGRGQQAANIANEKLGVTARIHSDHGALG